MSALSESKKNFKQELRKFVSMFFNDVNLTEINRQRDRVRQLLSDVRSNAVVMFSDGSQIQNVNKDQTHQIVKGAGKATTTSTTTTAAATAAAQALRLMQGNSSISSLQFNLTLTPGSSLRADMSVEDFFLASITGLPRDIRTEINISLVFVEECFAAAQYLMGKDMYEEVAELFLEPLAKEIQIALHGIATQVEATCHNLHFGPSEGNNVDNENDERGVQNTEEKRFQRVMPSQMPAHVKELLQAWRLVVQCDLLRYTCEFYLSFCVESPLGEQTAMFGMASTHLESMTSRLLTVAAVDADNSYYILFNGSIMVYEMCLHMMRKAGNCVGDVVQYIIRHVAICLDICESATLKLATVRYMPWRLRLYDYLATCYEIQGAYTEALLVAQRASRKVRELIDLEMLDPVLPPLKSRETMLAALDHVMLNVLRYTWYVNNTKGTNQTGGGGGVTDGTQSAKQSPHSVQSLNVGTQQELPLGDMPRDGIEMIDRAWQLLLRVELPKRSTGVSSLTPSTKGTTAKQQQQQCQDAATREQTAERIQGALVRFLLSFVTAPTSPASLLSSVNSFQEWAIEALEFLARRAVCTYVQAHPDVQKEGLPAEFVEALVLPQRKQASPSPTVNTKGGKKNTTSRRPNRSQPSASVNPPAVEDESFLSKVLLENILYNLALPNISIPTDTEKNIGIKTLKIDMINEESLLLALLLHRVLYNGMDAKLFGRLCTCSLTSLRQYRVKDEMKQNTIIKTTGGKRVGIPSRRELQSRVVESVFISLRILQRMRRVDSGVVVCIGELIFIAQDLERLVEIYAGPNLVSVGCKTQQVKRDALITTSPTLLSTSKALSSSLGALHQRLIEKCADFLQKHVSSFAPSALKSAFSLKPATILTRNTTSMFDENREEDVQESTDMYHNIVWTYLGAKVNSGLTDASKIGQLVLTYAKEVEAEISTNTGNSLDSSRDNDNISSKKKCQDNTRCDGGSLKGTTKRTSEIKKHNSFSDLAYALDNSIQAQRKTCNRVRTALDVIHMALECFEKRQTRPTLMKRSLRHCISHMNVMSKTESIGAFIETCEEKEERNDELIRIRLEQETRDTRTELTRWMVELRWHFAIHRQHYAALEKYKSDIKLLMDRQANTKVYGTTTLKELNVLEDLLKGRPEAPRVNEEEEKRLLTWARDEGDELLHALVLMCLAPHKLHSKAQREMLEEAFHLLQRYEKGRGGKSQAMIPSVKQQEGSAYSALMIWCYAVTTCGKLGFTNMTESAKNVLLEAFASSSDVYKAVWEKKKKKEGTTSSNNPMSSPFFSPVLNSAVCASNSVQPPVLTVYPNEEILTVSSMLQIQTLVLALLWLSTVEMRRIPYHNFDTTGLMPFTGKSLLLEVPFERRYGLSKSQLWYLRSAYIIQFAMKLADRVNDSSLMLQCAFELFNTLLPSLMDENYCSFLLPLLFTLCEALMRQTASVWSDAYVQRLAVRTLDALLKTVNKMSALSPDAGLKSGNTTTTTGTLNGTTGVMVTMPSSVQEWYEFVFRVFVHVWNLVYNHPNPRQLRYRESVRQGVKAVQRVLDSHQDGLEGFNSSRASFIPTESYVPPPMTDFAANATAEAVGLKTDKITPPAFPGGCYAVADTILDDVIPIEFLELLGDILFTVPCGISFLTQTSTVGLDKSTSLSPPKDTSDILEGVPAWLLSLAKALMSKSPNSALERLQQAEDDPLYAKTAVYVVEHFLRQGDTATARRVATDALQTMQKQHKSVREHQQDVLENMIAWLEREGYKLVPQTRSRRKTASEDPPVKGKKRMNKSTVKEAEQAPVQVEIKSHKFGNSDEREWTLAERQMLRQLTRGFAWVRRRRALRWLRGRILQFTVPYKAQLEFYLSICAHHSLERQQRQLQESAYAAAAAATTTTTAMKMRTGAKTKTRGEEAAEAPTAAGAGGVVSLIQTEELQMDEKERLVRHAVHAAVLFNRCGFPSRAFMAISQAVDGLRVFVCGEPPDLTLPDEELLPQDGVRRGDRGDESPRAERESIGTLADFSSAHGRGNDKTQIVVEIDETLNEWGPRVLPLAYALCNVTALIWGGFFDGRRDVEFLQPAAVKVGRDVLLEEQLRFQGRVPSLCVYTSAPGQYEEARLAHLAVMNRERLALSLRWRTQELEGAEGRSRANVHQQWLKELQELLSANLKEGLSSLASHAAALRRGTTAPVGEEETVTTTQQEQSLTKIKKMPNNVKIQKTAPESMFTDDTGDPLMIALRLGSALPAGKIIEHLMFILRYMQFKCQLASLELSVEVHRLTRGFFASELLPFVLTLQRSIGVPESGDLIDEYAKLCRNKPMHKALIQNAEEMWKRYMMTDAYRRAVNRLARTLLPSKSSSIRNICMNATSAIEHEVSSGASEETLSCARPAANSGMQRVTVRDVIARFESATALLQQRRFFGPLAEQLYELGRIHFLHRQRVETERCWLEAVDSALETPESLKCPPSTWVNFSVTAIGLPRVLLAVLSLSSLAMYLYREQQGRAVDAYLLAARILERFFEQGTTSNFPRQLREFGGFAVEDLIVLPHLGNSILTLMPQLVHHLLFIAWELLKFKFYFYAAMVASLTEYFARVHMRHVASTIEARLVQALAASYCGNHRASMKVLRNVCQGVRIPCGAIEGTALRVRAAVECIETVKSVKGGKRGDGGGAGVGHRPTDLQVDQQQTPHLQTYLSPEGLYDDSELPVMPDNVACVQTFLAQCFKENSVSPIALGVGATSPSLLSHTASAGSNVSVLHEAVVAFYGPRLSQRVELAVAESLIALGSKEAAYVWCSFAGCQRPGTADKRSGRSRSSPVISLHNFSNSACLEALSAAENILQSLLMRLQQPLGTSMDMVRKRSSTREKNTLSSREILQEGHSLDMEETYIRCTSELLLARIYTARGECAKAIALLQGLITDFNEMTGRNLPGLGGSNAPSYLWTVATHIFWCDVYELIVLNYVRSREYGVARQVIHDALALCEQCGDPYSGRVFSLYEAAITARSGDITKATKTLYTLQQVSYSLKIDSRSDMMHAWIIMAAEFLRRGAQCKEMETSSLSSSSVERLELSVRALREYCEIHGLLSELAPSLETSHSLSTTKTGMRQQLFVAWNVKAIFLHCAMNFLAEEYIRIGKLDLAEAILQHAITTIAPQYDASAHPTPLIESRFILARLLCLLNPSLLTEQQNSKDGCEAKFLQELTENEMISALDSPRQKPVQLLIAVINQVVTSGTHDYSVLRLALLHLAMLLSRAERSFQCLAANCVVLAKLVEDMQFHVFSGGSVFSLYGEDIIQLGSDITFSESIAAVIYSTRRGLGHITEKDITNGGGTTTPLSPRGTPELRRPFPRSRSEKEETSQKNMVPLPIIVSAFASLHREKSLQLVFPPLELLHLETALQHLRAYLQLKTAPLSGYYLWYKATMRDAFIKQQQQLQQQQGRTGESGRSSRTLSVATDTNTTTTTTSLLPPILINRLPPLLSFGTIAQLGIPKVNTVICQSFVRDAIKLPQGAIAKESSRNVVEQKNGGTLPAIFSSISQSEILTCFLFMSPVYDPNITQPPPLSEKSQPIPNKKHTRAPRKSSAGNMDIKGTMDLLPSGLQWDETRCVVFELPMDELQSVFSNAVQTLELMQNSSNSIMMLSAENEEEEMPVEAALSQQLNEAMAVLTAKAAPPAAGRKGLRTAAPAEFIPVNTTQVGSLFTARQGTTVNQMEGVTTVAELDTKENLGEVPAVDEAKSKLITGFLELFVRSVVPRAVTDDNLMERCVQELLPRCAVSVDMVQFLKSMAAGNGGSISLFHPGLYEWFSRMANFVMEHA